MKIGDEMIERGDVSVVLTPWLRQLALNHVRDAEQGEDEENLTRWFQEQETPDGHVLDARNGSEETHMIVVIARALLWTFDLEADAADRADHLVPEDLR